MQSTHRTTSPKGSRISDSSRVEEFPLTVAPEWDDLVRRGDLMAEVIDKHLDFESRLQGRELSPITLCPDQKVTLATDLSVL